MKNNYIIIGIVAVIVVAFFGWMFISQSRPLQTNQVAQTVTTPAPQASDSAMGDKMASDSAMMMGNVKEITVEGSNFKFVPAEIKVKKGDKVKITFKNSGGTHDFVIDEFKVKTKTVKGGAEETVEFSADKVGTFEYYCSVGTHRAMGMKGSLIVE